MSSIEEARKELTAYLASDQGRARAAMSAKVLERAQVLDRTLRSLADDLRTASDLCAVITRFEEQITAVEEELHEAHSLYSAMLDILERHGL